MDLLFFLNLHSGSKVWKLIFIQETLVWRIISPKKFFFSGESKDFFQKQTHCDFF